MTSDFLTTDKPHFARYFPSLRRESEFNSDIHMFMEDVALWIMPLGGRPETASDFSVEIRGIGDSVARAVKTLESFVQYRKIDWKELLSDVVTMIARGLVENGRAVYEIVQDEENPGAYLLRGFTSRRLFRLFGKCVQIVPRAERGQWQKSYFVLPARDVWDITVPRVLMGWRRYRTMRSKLARFQPVGPSFLMDEMSRNGLPANYDFQRYRREVELFAAKTTTPWGWHRRDYEDRNWTKFYLSHRILRFRWAQASLREHIVKELNNLLRRLNIDAEIVVKGLPTPADILKVQQRMRDGDISFKEAEDKCFV